MSFSAGKRGRYSYEKKCQYALKSGEIKRSKIQEIPRQPQQIEDEVVVLATRLSEVFLSNSTYPEDYFENIASLRKANKVKIHFLLSNSVGIYSFKDIVKSDQCKKGSFAFWKKSQ